jgi:transposase
VALAAFPKGNEYLRLRDELTEVFTDSEFAELYAAQGQAAASPGLLAWVTVLQYKEGWSDRAAAEAVRARLDLKYLLGLPLKDAGFHHSVLGEFRQRLLAGGKEGLLLDRILTLCQAKGLLHARGRQRTDSTPVLAAVRDLNRLECVGETLRQALNHLADLAPEWLHAQAPAAWYERYGQRIEAAHLAKTPAEARAWQTTIGQDGYALLTALADPRTPAYLAAVPSVRLLHCVWWQQYYVADDQLRWRSEAEGLPPSKLFVQSPYDPAARFRTKRQTRWTGYLVHLTETCDDTTPHLITNVATVPASTADVELTTVIHQQLAAKALLPSEHLVDTAYVSAPHLVEGQTTFHLDLVGPTPPVPGWQAHAQQGFDVTCFALDWDNQRATCPAGQLSYSWRIRTKAGVEAIEVSFAAADCTPCPHRQACTHAARHPRMLALQPKAQQQALHAARQRQQTPEFKQRYKRRAGIEGTFSQGVRAFELRRTRFIGLAKTHLQHIATAAAINLARLADWFAQMPSATTRASPFKRLAQPLT